MTAPYRRPSPTYDVGAAARSQIRALKVEDLRARCAARRLRPRRRDRVLAWWRMTILPLVDAEAITEPSSGIGLFIIWAAICVAGFVLVYWLAPWLILVIP